MSSRAFLIAIVVAAAVTSAFAADHYTVGDGAGWSLGLNYTDWAKGNDFRVGDTLTFLYTPGDHNVLEVSTADSEGCTSSDPAAFPYISGNDTVLLTSPGEKWYICDLGNHCLKGMKLGIIVSAAADGLPPPSLMTGSAHVVENFPVRYCGWMCLLMIAYWMIMG